MQNSKSEFEIKKFKKIVKRFYKDSGRDMPWRKTRDPYKILVSEVMLQQTQVARVMEKYPTFIKRFPTVGSLARAPFSTVLKEWSGLGYNRRAKFLRQAAEKIVARHSGRVPDSLDALIALPGVGKSTAGGILAFAHNKPAVFIETNIRRVFIHHFFPHKKHVADTNILPLVEQTLDYKNPREWYYALFDYGTHIAETLPNPNRKSAHYLKQSRFSGSERQLRGQILKSLLVRPFSRGELLRLSNLTPTKTLTVLHNLITEGFIQKQGSRYMLK